MTKDIECLNFQDSMILINDEFKNSKERDGLLGKVIFDKMEKQDKLSITELLNLKKLSNDIQGGVYELYFYNDISIDVTHICNILITTLDEAIELAENISCLDYRTNKQLSHPSGHKNIVERAKYGLTDIPLADKPTMQLINEILNGYIKDKNLIFDILINSYSWMSWPAMIGERGNNKNFNALLRIKPNLMKLNEPGFDSYIYVFNTEAQNLSLEEVLFYSKEQKTYHELSKDLEYLVLKPIRSVNIKHIRG